MSAPESLRHARHFSVWCASVLFGLLWMPSAAPAQAPAQLVGSVLDATGLALAGVTVTLRGASDGSPTPMRQALSSSRTSRAASTN